MFGLDKLLKVVDPDPVIINQQACLRARHVQSKCRACSELCPEGAFSFEDRKLSVDQARCTRCGLCLGACPTAAIAVRGIDERLLDGAAEVRCAKAGGTGVTLPCLGALSADHMIDLGSRRPGVVLHAGECEQCELARGGAVARENLAAATEVLQALGVEKLPVWRTGKLAPAGATAEVSRRELLALFGRSAVQTGQSFLPDREVNPIKLPAKVPARRLRWLKRFTVPAADAGSTLPWPTRQVAEGCIACKICVAFCPTGALAARDEAGKWLLSFQATACVDCGTCVQLCPPRLISPGPAPALADVVGGTRQDVATGDPGRRPQLGGR